jgi:Protein of unknown function (DUF3800)
MSELYNVYCDESCHLENDGEPVMLVGAVWCAKADAHVLANELRALKQQYNAKGELKWTKVSKSRMAFYEAVVDWFFARPALHFRGLVVKHKERLDHQQFNQGSHDAFYYKMYFSLLNKILSPDRKYNVYLDIKDTRGRQRLKLLREVLCNNVHDFTSEMIEHIQNVHSREVELMQVTDLLLGAIASRHRTKTGSPEKLALVQRVEKLHRRDLLGSTSLSEQKLNLFLFTPRAAAHG